MEARCYAQYLIKKKKKKTSNVGFLFSAGSVVQQDLTERLCLMNGLCSPVKTKGVVPHDIGDPGEKRNTTFAFTGNEKLRPKPP